MFDDVPRTIEYRRAPIDDKHQTAAFILGSEVRFGGDFLHLLRIVLARDRENGKIGARFEVLPAFFGVPAGSQHQSFDLTNIVRRFSHRIFRRCTGRKNRDAVRIDTSLRRQERDRASYVQLQTVALLRRKFLEVFFAEAVPGAANVDTESRHADSLRDAARDVATDLSDMLAE